MKVKVTRIAAADVMPRQIRRYLYRIEKTFFMHFRKGTQIITVLLLALFALPGEAQIRPGIKFGISTPDVSPSDILVTDQNGNDYYRIFVERARYGLHGGVFIQMQLGGFFFQPEFLYNSTRVDYKLDKIFNPDIVSATFTDTYRSLDFPLILGLKTGVVRLGGGPVGHLNFQDEGGFAQFDGFSEAFDEINWGWQAGLGLDLWKLHIDVRYEGSFYDLGDHITFFGKQFDFATSNNKLIASLGFSF
jgi:hypothetical protein